MRIIIEDDHGKSVAAINFPDANERVDTKVNADELRLEAVKMVIREIETMSLSNDELATIFKNAKLSEFFQPNASRDIVIAAMAYYTQRLRHGPWVTR